MRARDRVTVAAGAGALLASVFAVGGAFRWAQAIVAACMAIAVVPLWWSRRELPLRSPLLWLPALAALLTLVQLIPLPDALLASLQPTGAALRADGAALAGTSPWHAITLDAPGSLRSVAFFVTLLAVALAALRFAATERGRYALLGGVALVCGLAAIVVWIHELLGANSLYGLYRPEQAHPSVLGPLLNENHLGGLMALGAVVSLGLTMYARQQPRWRPVWLLNTALCAVTTVASESRGATLALLGGCALTGGMLIAARMRVRTLHPRSRHSFATTSLPLIVIAVCSIALVVYIGGAAVTEQIERTEFAEVHAPLSKFAIWRSAISLVQDAPVLGVGRGAFEPAFTRVHPASAVHSFSHVENEYLQTVVDWGLLGAALLAAAAAMLLVRAVRRWRDSPLHAGAIGAVAAVAVQSNVDFGIELLGLAVPATIVAATLAYVPMRDATSKQRLFARVLLPLLAMALLGSAAMLLSSSTRSIAEDHDDLARTTDVASDEITAEIQRHPLDYYGFAVAAQTMYRHHQPDAVRYVNHALRLHPTHSGLHHLAALMLYEVGNRAQANVEYSLALAGTPDSRTLIAEVASRFSAHDAARAMPLDYDHFNQTLNLLLELKRDRIVVEWLLRALDAHVAELKACRSLYSFATHSGDLQSAETASARCKGVAPSYRDRIDLARMLLTHDRPDDALAALSDVENWPVRIDVKAAGWLVVCDSQIAKAKWPDAERCLHRLDATGYLRDAQRDQITTRLKKVDDALHPR